jgi:hypothetical protein
MKEVFWWALPTYFQVFSLNLAVGKLHLRYLDYNQF